MAIFKEAEKFERNRISKMVVYIIILAVVITAIVGVLFYRFTYNYFVGNFIRQHLEIVSALANSIDGDTYKEIFSSDNPADSEEYRRILKHFVSTAHSSTDIQYAYTFHLNEDKTEVLFGFDGELEPYDSIRIETIEFMYIISFDGELNINFITEEEALYSENDQIPFICKGSISYLNIVKQDGQYAFKNGGDTVFTIGLDNGKPYFISENGKMVDNSQNYEHGFLHAGGAEVEAEIFFNEKGASVSYPNQVYVDEEGALAEEFDYLLSPETSPTYFVEDTSLGTFYTFYAPIFDKSGNKVARVGIDVDITILTSFSRASIIGFIETIIPVILILLLSFVVFYLLREKRMLALNGTIIYLNKTLDELKVTQSKLIKTEKLAALGKLVSNIAHEINNPVSAILNSSQTIGERLKTVIEQIIRNDSLDAKDFDFLSTLTELSVDSYYIDLPFRQRAILKKEVYASLESKEIDTDLAEGFFRLGIYQVEKIDGLLSIFESSNANDIFSIAHMLSSILISAENIGFGCKKVGKIVHLLRQYASDVEIELNDEVDICKLLDQAVYVFHSQYRYNTTVEKSYKAALVVKGNESVLLQAFMNIIQNAFQAMIDGGKLEIKSEISGGDVVVEVIDTGCGMSEDDLSTIFEPFYTTRNIGEGSGLGMFFVKNVVEYHGGEISITSEPDKGTTVTIRLPQYVEAAS